MAIGGTVMKKNTILKLRILLLVVLIGIAAIFYIFFPTIGLFFKNDGPEYADLLMPYTLWSVLASLPLCFSVYLLWEIVNKLSRNVFFDLDIYHKFRTISRIIIADVIVCIIIFGITLLYIDTNPGVILICFILAILGVLVSAFFSLMGLWVLKGYEIKEEMDLTI